MAARPSRHSPNTISFQVHRLISRKPLYPIDRASDFRFTRLAKGLDYKQVLTPAENRLLDMFEEQYSSMPVHARTKHNYSIKGEGHFSLEKTHIEGTTVDSFARLQQ